MRALRERVAAEPLGGIGAGGTILMHGAVLLLLVAGRGGGAQRPLPMAYRVELIAGPAPTAPTSAPASATRSSAWQTHTTSTVVSQARLKANSPSASPCS